MIWWYKEIFISHSSNTQIDEQSVTYKKRTHTMKNAYAKIKSVIQLAIEYQRNKRLNQHSYRVLSQLDDHYLADIGLINEDLHLLSNGKLPQRFSQTKEDKIIPADVRLISTGAVKADVVATVAAEAPLFEPAQFDKAA